MLVLGIESSCDECAAAVVQDGRLVRSTQVATQISIHAPYGGVVPELASRDHLRRISLIIAGAVEKAGIEISGLDAIAVTCGPGLQGSLLIGTMAARTLAWALGCPLVGVNHLEAHLHAAFLEQKQPQYPFLGLVVSGGHTSLFEVRGVGRLKLLGRTLDDAAGEALDKVAKLLGLPYPGGVWIERQAAGGNPDAVPFPRPMRGRGLDFSFSGLKTAACQAVRNRGAPQGQDLSDFAASFQKCVVETLVAKTITALKKHRLARLVVAGGVAANRLLRERMSQEAKAAGAEIFIPALSLCTDNAAMVAALGQAYLQAGRSSSPFELDADASLPWNAISL